MYLTNCEKDNNYIPTRSVVVESYVTPGDSVSIQVFQILQYTSTDTVTKTIDNCIIQLFHNNKIYQVPFVDSGLYILKGINPKIQAGDSVSIRFEVNNEIISASTTIPQKPTNYTSTTTSITMPDFSAGFNRELFRGQEPIELSWNNDDESYYMVVVKPIDTTNNLIYSADTIGRPRIRVFRNEPSISSYYRLEIFNFSYYGYQNVILYHLNPEYAALYKFSGNTSLNIKEPPTNINNGFGIFTGLNADTITVNVKKSSK